MLGLMGPKRKEAIKLIISGGKSDSMSHSTNNSDATSEFSPKDGPMSEEDQGYQAGKDAAAEQCMDCMKSGDVAGFRRGLEDFVTIVMNAGGTEAYNEDDDEGM